MNPLQRLLALDAAEKAALGIEATPAEIAQQPEMWRDTARRFADAAPAIRDLLAQVGLPGGSPEIVFAGAGTSDFVGRCLQGPVSAALATRAIACPTTDIVTHPQYAFPADRPALMVSFARSGNSPESVAAMDAVLDERPRARHLVITCNEDGELAQRARGLGDRAYTLVLHPRTNDRGLAMTSAFTSMVVAGLGLAFAVRIDEYLGLVDRMAAAGETMLDATPAAAEAMAKRGPRRACFLGSGALYGAAVESHLKLQELTDGSIICLCDTFLGIRHGPRAAIHDDTLVVYFLSSDPAVRRYELDLIRGNHDQGVGLAHLIVADRTDDIAGQLLGLFASLERGLKPDEPSAAGVIHRVVRGVTIYPREHSAQ